MPDEGTQGRQQVRIALVMNGGVSLAVWMGGVTHEINRMLRRDHPVYAMLLDLTRATARVDVIAGTSAGGLNGALLAAALVYDKPLDEARTLWRTHGSFSTLMRSPFDKEPPSLMKGDEHFFPRLKEAFETFVDGPPRSVDDQPIELILTTTTLSGNQRALRDDFGGIIADKSHSGRLTFCHGPRVRHFPDHTDREAQRKLARKLALSARCSASYPFAFEPSYVPIGAEVDKKGDVPQRPDMQEHANFEVSRYAMDGGVLMNRPFRPAIDAIFRQGTTEDVGLIRRVMAYVVADPGRIKQNEADPQEMPTLMKSLRGGLLAAPFAQSVANEIADIRRHNRQVDARRALRESLLDKVASSDELFALAARLFDPYLEIRIRGFVERAVESLVAGAGKAGEEVFGPVEALLRNRAGELRDALAGARRDWLPRVPPVSDANQRPWRWGLSGFRDLCVVLIDLVRRAHEIAPEGADVPSIDVDLGVLRAIRGTVHDLLTDVLPPEEWHTFWSQRAESLATAGDDLMGWARQSLEEWLATYQPELDIDDILAPMANQLPGLLIDAGPPLRRIAAAARAWGEERGGSWFLERAYALESMTEVLVSTEEAVAPRREVNEQHILNRLLAVHVAHRALMVDSVVEQGVELIQISADVDTVIDPVRKEAADKLTGLQLAHFGAFYKESWRVNDWMWGRLDGSARLVEILVQPKRLRQLGRTPDDVVAALLQVPHLQATQSSWEAPVRDEVAFLDDSSVPTPQNLHTIARLLTEAVQLDGASAEVPLIAHAIARDKDAGSPPSREAEDFRQAVEAAGEVTTDNVKPLLAACGVGKEKIFFGEVRSARFLEDAATAAAVTSATLAGPRSGLGFARAVMGAVRNAMLGVWAVVRSARLGGSGAIAMVALMAFAGALLAIEISREANVPSALLWVALGVLGAGILTATIRAFPQRIGTAIGATLAVVLTVAVAALIQIGLDGEGWLAVLRPVLTVAVLVGGLAALPYVRDRLLDAARERLLQAIAWALSLALAIVAVVIPERFGDDLRWNDWTVTGIRIAGVLILGALIGWLLRRREPELEEESEATAEIS